MNKDFENEIVRIAQNSKNKASTEKSGPSSEDRKFLDAIEQLYLISHEAIKIFNSTSKDNSLSAYKLPGEFLEMFLEIPDRRGGLCIISPKKLIIFFDEDPDLITVIGKKRNIEGSTNKTTQLLKAKFSNIDGELKYKDNTGGQLDPYDVVALLIRWIAS